MIGAPQTGLFDFVNARVLQEQSSKRGSWMIWMVHRAHLDDPTLVKFATRLSSHAGVSQRGTAFSSPCASNVISRIMM